MGTMDRNAVPGAAPTVLASSDPSDMTDRYNTKLSPADEAAYQAWAKKNGKENDTYDYDMRGAFAGGVTQSDNGHFPDTYKKPNHPTFSNESKYSGVDGEKGGTWGKGPSGGYTFTPGPSNLKRHGKDGLQDYFKRVEPDAQLIF